jgi:hypothetical protein
VEIFGQLGESVHHRFLVLGIDSRQPTPDQPSGEPNSAFPCLAVGSGTWDDAVEEPFPECGSLDNNPAVPDSTFRLLRSYLRYFV